MIRINIKKSHKFLKRRTQIGRTSKASELKSYLLRSGPGESMHIVELSGKIERYVDTLCYNVACN